jgi:hypothetical protein
VEALQFHSNTVSLVQGQPFASHLGGQQFTSRGCTNSQWNRVSPVSIVSLHWWPPLGSAPTMGSFTRHSAGDVKSQLWSHIAFPSSIPLLGGPVPPPHSDWLEPQSSCWGEPCGGPAISLQYTSHWSNGSTVCSPNRGSAVHVPGRHKLTIEPVFSYLRCLATRLPFKSSYKASANHA